MKEMMSNSNIKMIAQISGIDGTNIFYRFVIDFQITNVETEKQKITIRITVIRTPTVSTIECQNYWVKERKRRVTAPIIY